MELPRRARGDELLRPGSLLDLRRRLRRVAPRHDLATVIAYAFDQRTHMLPFVYAATRMAPAGPRAVGSALADAGFEKTRIVLQQWSPGFRPAQMRLDGRIPDLFMVSSMQLHAEACTDLLRDVCRIDPRQRPLVIAGGPKFIYEPWGAFGAGPGDPWTADVAVTGEEYVLLSLLEVLLAERGAGESLRSTFLRARDGGLLDEIPGLVYARSGAAGAPEELIDTGVQRLVGDLDELPHPVLGYRLLEPPSRCATLASRALRADEVARYSSIGSLVLTFGCKFACPYCPIPAYNQRQLRVKSGERVADEFRRLHDEYGIRSYFGADDNFFDNTERTLDIVETLARTPIAGRPFRKRIRWGTEVTVHDTLRLREHLGTVRLAGVRALWLGVEDMTATLVKKGQSVGKTVEALHLLNQHGISPMPMMMHHDEQPLLSRGEKPYGLLNQIRLLRKAGAISMQVLMLVPATGSKLYTGTYTSGMAYESVGGRKVREHMLGGNYVIASNHPRPWIKQINILLAYLYFYNPLRFLVALVRPKSKLYLADAILQVLGMNGLVLTACRTFTWTLRLCFGRIERQSAVPTSRLPMRGVGRGAAAHALPGTPLAVDALPRPAGAGERSGKPLPVLAGP
ncbi:MAG: radical SAM protein [Phycisphaerae bacterium]|nr:radical SAM protein [Phycisphaerae bacterium]MCZ2401565.1 radical SAM protein [Phycisphaerae bacterium]